MGKKILGTGLLVCCLLLVVSTVNAGIMNRGVEKEAAVETGKLNTETNPNAYRTLAEGQNRYWPFPKPTNAQQITPATAYNGVCWYDSTDDKMECVIGGAKVDIGAGAAADTLDTAYTAGASITLDATGNLVIQTNPDSNPAYLLLDTVTGAGALADMLKVTTTSGTITDAIDLSDAGIVNAINVGANVIIGTGASIDFSEFDVSATTGAITIDDDGDAGSLTVEGTVLDINSLDFVGAGAITSAASSAITINPNAGNAAGEDLIITAHNVQLTATGAITMSPDAGVTTAIDITDTDYTNAISVGDNAILGTTGIINYTNFDVDAAGAVTCTGLDAGAGDIVTTGNLNVGNVIESAVQPAAGDLTINAATGANSITIGNLSTSGINVSDNVAFAVTSLFTSGAGLGFRQATEVISSSVVGQLDIDAAGELEIATAVLDVNLTDSSDIGVVGAGKNFDISTSDGDITFTAAGAANGDVVIVAGDDLDIDTTGLVDILAAGIFSIDGTGNSNVSATSGNLTLSTITTGDVDILSAAEVDIDASGTSAINANTAGHATATTGAINLTTGNVAGGAGNSGAIIATTGTSAGGARGTAQISAGLIDLDAAANLDIDVTGSVDILASTTVSIDGTGNSNVSATSGNLVLSTITAGSVDILSATDVDIDASVLSGVTINTANEATDDANPCGDITLTGGNKGAGTGDGGDIILAPGSTTGGVQGYAKFSGDALFATTKKAYFYDTGLYVGASADGKLVISSDGAGTDDITIVGSTTIPTGHVWAFTDAGSITLAAEKVTAHKQVVANVYATANTANSFGILPIIDNCKITHISIGFVAVPASGAGTVLLEVYNRDGGAASDNLLVAATFDLETMTNTVTSDLSLTATGADLQPDDSDFVYCVITSNNGDMTGGTGGVITVKYTID